MENKKFVLNIEVDEDTIRQVTEDAHSSLEDLVLREMAWVRDSGIATIEVLEVI